MLKKKNLLSLILALCLCYALAAPAWAAEMLVTEEQESILLEIGIPENIIAVMPQEDIDELISKYIDNPDSVQVSSGTMEIDVLAEMRNVVDSKDSELLDLGYSTESIKQARDIIDTYNETTDEELLDSGLSQNEVDYLRYALNPNREDVVKPRGVISTAKLTLTQTVTDYSSSDHPNYFVSVYFNWDSPYYNVTYNDKLAIAWGGGLNQEQSQQSVQYYNINNLSSAFTDYVGVTSPTYFEHSINAIGVYEFPQSYSKVSLGKSGIVKQGHVRYQIYQNRYTNTDTKVTATYGHQILAVTSGIQVSGSGAAPIVTFGTGYDYATISRPNIIKA